MPSNKQSFLTKEYRQELDRLIENIRVAEYLAVAARYGKIFWTVKWAKSNLADAELNLTKFLDVATEKE